MSKRLAKRLLIVGWDAADWKIIDALFDHGGMPNLRRIVDAGVRGNLASLEPRLSPLLWTTIATGKTADKHGILNFVEPDPTGGGMRVVSSTSRKTKALWNMLTQSGFRVNVVNWYASHPAEPINGVCVSNLFQEGVRAGETTPMLKGAVHPEQSAERVAEARLRPLELTVHDLIPFVPDLKEADLRDERVQLLARHIMQCASVHNAATAILTDDQAWDCTMVYYDTIDTLGHHFMQFHPPRMPHVSDADFQLFCEVMYGVYQFHDMMLGTLLNLAGPETTLLLVSDHGFYSDHRRPVIKDLTTEQRLQVEASWHRPLGVLAMSGPAIKRAETIYSASLLDITPTALTLLGLPVGADMGGRVLAEAIDDPVKLETVFSWDLVNGEAGMHPADLRQDPFEACDAIRQLVELGYMDAPPEDAKARMEIARRESQCNLGTVYTTSGQPDLAIGVFEELNTRYPQERRFVLGLGRSLLVSGRYEECVSITRRYLVDQASASPDVRTMLVVALASAEQNADADMELDQLERDCGSSVEQAAVLGEACASLGRWDDADRHFRHALQRDPDAAAIYHGLARVAVGRKQFEDAVEHCLHAVALVHVFPEVHHVLGMALVGLGDMERAIQSFKVAISMRPGLLDSHRYLASIYRDRGDTENAGKHRQVSERIMRDHSTGAISADFLKREAPLGPGEWMRRDGSTASGEAVAVP